MRYFFDDWDSLKRELVNKYILLFLDYDGTLTPIVVSPDKAVITQETRGLLKKLSQISKCRIAIISGRGLKDIKKMVGLKGIIYAGNHGLEIEGPKIKFKSPVFKNSKFIMKQIKDDLNKKVSSIDGAFIEDKGLTLSLHYRLVDKDNTPLIKNIFNNTVQPYLIEKRIRVTSGKKVFEVRPPIRWDKGKVVLWLLARQRFISGDNNIFPFYLGDDVTDEDAFKALKNKGLTIFVGEPRQSYAQYYVTETKEVIKLLKKILNVLEVSKTCQG